MSSIPPPPKSSTPTNSNANHNFMSFTATNSNPTRTPKPTIKSSQNGGIMEGWNDVPLLGALLNNNGSSKSLTSKNRKKRVASYVYPVVDPLKSALQRLDGINTSSNVTPSPPPPPPPQPLR